MGVTMASAMASIKALKATHQQLKSKMESTVEDFRGHLQSARTGRANVHMLDQIKVDYYGTDTPVAQMGQVSTPEPTMIEEQRKDVVKGLQKALEDHKTAIRNIRRDGNDQIKKAAKDKLISADDEKRANEEVQQLTDAEIRRIEDLFKAKEKEVLTV